MVVKMGSSIVEIIAQAKKTILTNNFHIQTAKMMRNISEASRLSNENERIRQKILDYHGIYIDY